MARQTFDYVRDVFISNNPSGRVMGAGKTRRSRKLFAGDTFEDEDVLDLPGPTSDPSDDERATMLLNSDDDDLDLPSTARPKSKRKKRVKRIENRSSGEDDDILDLPSTAK